MKNTWKKYAAVAMAGILSAGMLAGCGAKEKYAEFDGTKTVATINGEEIPMGLLSYVVRNQQAYIKQMYEAYGLSAYMSSLWDGKETEDSELTYGEETRNNVLEQVETMYLLRAKAADYGVEVTAEDQEKIAEAAAAFMEANSEETIAALGVTEDMMKTYLELQTYLVRMHEPIVADADHEVSDEQAQMSAFSYVHVTVKEEEEASAEEEIDAETTDDAETEESADDAVVEDAEAEAGDAAEDESAEEAVDAETEEGLEEEAETEETEEPAEPTEAELKAKELAEAFHEALSKDTDADMSELAKTVDESLTASTGTFQTNLSDEWEDDTASYYNEDMVAALRELKEGEITAVIETEDEGYYIARLDKELDEEATEKERESIISTRENDFYTDTTEAWLADAEVTVDEEVLNTLKVTDAMVFSTVSNTEEEIPEEDGIETEVEDTDAEDADGEIVEEVDGETVEELEELPEEEVTEEEIPEEETPEETETEESEEETK